LTGLAAIPGRTLSARRGPARQQPIRMALTVQCPLTRSVSGEARSWRPWGGHDTEQDALAERQRIEGDLARLAAAAGYPLEVRPLRAVQNPEPAAGAGADVMLLYAASGRHGCTTRPPRRATLEPDVRPASLRAAVRRLVGRPPPP